MNEEETNVSTETNKTLAKRYLDVVNGQKLNQLDEIFASDYVHHDPNLPPDVQRGLDNYKRGISGFITAFPDLQGTAEDIVAEGDRVVTRLTWRGTHNGDLMGIPATGRKVNFSTIEIQRVANGKIAEGWVTFDAMTMMQQIGAVPTPG